MVDYKGMVRAVWRWLNNEEEPMEEVAEDTQEIIKEVVAEVAEGQVRPNDEAPVAAVLSWDEKYAAGVSAIRTANTSLRAVRGEVEGARKGVDEATKSMVQAEADLAGSQKSVAMEIDRAVKVGDIQISLLQERRAALVGE